MISVQSKETIAAIATPSGKGGVGIVRVSGPKVCEVIRAVLGKELLPRHARFLPFYDKDKTVIDQGIAIYFKAPYSMTGEDVLELQAHGGPVLLNYLLERVLALDVRAAKPGEFLESAFLNDKIDLTQAEAIADLIEASSIQAARSAMRSLQGEFSKQVNDIVILLIELRKYVEASIDFSDEEIDFLGGDRLSTQIDGLIKAVQRMIDSAQQGALLRDGLTIAIVGKPNVGKSSLLNALSGQESAIVCDIPGTTRDIIKETLQLDGLPINIVDTAGIRESEDKVEQEGVRRAHQAISVADKILLVVDASRDNAKSALADIQASSDIERSKITIILNKIDLTNELPGISEYEQLAVIALSIKNESGVDALKSHLKAIAGYHTECEGVFMARARHLAALATAKKSLEKGGVLLREYKAGELLAEELRYAQQALSEITGKMTADELLGEIFSSFCIGK